MHIPFLLSPNNIPKLKLQIFAKKQQFVYLISMASFACNSTSHGFLLTMETQREEIQSTRSLRIPRISSVARDSDIIETLQYTSLKDIICNTPTSYYLTLYEENDFNSTLAIRNELVKRAASVYLQSAALLITKNENCFVTFWERLKNRAASYSRWRVSDHANPFRACLAPIYQFLNHMLGSIRSLP
ncbi:hypothetical protein GLYMA_08G098600v4 [Glycine max]|nr:hypothetical protein GLYMA_08G098600v4 [Glycine max]KAH1050456.1 hypothetical protein GYH30_020780 [Glycine max]